MVSPVAGCKADNSKSAPIAEIPATITAIKKKRVAGCGSLFPTLSIESKIELKRLFAMFIDYEVIMGTNIGRKIKCLTLRPKKQKNESEISICFIRKCGQ